MSLLDRAAQFAPFAALTGYDAVIAETGRLTEEKIEQEEYPRNVLDRKLQQLLGKVSSHPEVTVTYFAPDDRKSGGTYQTVTGTFKKLDFGTHMLFLSDDCRISLPDIIDIECDLLGDDPDCF